MATVKKPRLVLTEHPKQELEHWKQSLGRHLPVVDCTVLCTSPRGTAGVLLLCVVQRDTGVVAVMFHNVLFFRTEQGEWATHNYAGVFGQWCCHTDHGNFSVLSKYWQKIACHFQKLLKISRGYWWVGDLQKQELLVSHNWAQQTPHHDICSALSAKGNMVNLSGQLILAKFVRACQES